MLPKDPMILLSVVNTRLRDNYSDLDELCAAEDEDREALEAALAGICFRYDEGKKQFLPM